MIRGSGRIAIRIWVQIGPRTSSPAQAAARIGRLDRAGWTGIRIGSDRGRVLLSKVLRFLLRAARAALMAFGHTATLASSRRCRPRFFSLGLSARSPLRARLFASRGLPLVSDGRARARSMLSHLKEVSFSGHEVAATRGHCRAAACCRFCAAQQQQKHVPPRPHHHDAAPATIKKPATPTLARELLE